MSVSGGTMSGKKVAQDPIMATLAVLRDTKRFEARLKQLTDAEKSLRETTEKFGEISTLKRSRAAAERAKERAESALREAEEKAGKILQDAEEKASSVRQDLKNERAALDRETRERTNDLDRRSAQLAGDEEEFSKRNTSLKRSETNLRRKIAENNTLKRELERRASLLQTACNEALV